MPKILVTGGEGQLGKELNKFRNHLGFELIALSKNKLDITNKKQLRNVIEDHTPDIVINAAAYTSVDEAEKNVNLAEEINHEGVKNIAELCKEHSIFLIHVSTDYVFDGMKKDPYEEADKVNPLNNYGVTKKKGEDAIRQILSDYIILRTSWVFSSHGHSFVKTFLDLIKSKKDINIVNDQFGCPTSSISLAECILTICSKYFETKKIQFGTFHFSGSPSTSWYSFAQKINEIAYKNKIIDELKEIKPISSSDFNPNVIRPHNSSLSSKKISKTYKVNLSEWEKDLEQVMTSFKP